MDRKAYLAKLNWFYSLETEQVDLYLAQSKAGQDPHLAKLLEHVASVESGHVAALDAYIRGCGGKPTSPGGVVATLLGRAAGKASGLASPEVFLKLDIALEEKAMADYKALLDQAHEARLENLLWGNLIDEDLHTAWFAEYLAGRIPSYCVSSRGLEAKDASHSNARRLVRFFRRHCQTLRRYSGLSRDQYVSQAFRRMAEHTRAHAAQLDETRSPRRIRWPAFTAAPSCGLGRSRRELLRRALGAQRRQGEILQQLLDDGRVMGHVARVTEMAWYDNETQQAWTGRKLRDVDR